MKVTFPTPKPRFLIQEKVLNHYLQVMDKALLCLLFPVPKTLRTNPHF